MSKYKVGDEVRHVPAGKFSDELGVGIVREVMHFTKIVVVDWTGKRNWKGCHDPFNEVRKLSKLEKALK